MAKHAMYEVFKHSAPFAGKLWAVQFPNGIVCYTTKRQATLVANEAKGSK
jgi:hypothetical protein